MSESIKNSIEEYKNELNPTKVFFKDYCIENEGSKISQHEIYTEYANLMKENGHSPLNLSEFNREVKKYFKKVSPTQNANKKSYNGKRCREWEGLLYIK